jgi:uncharacterized repeat protein (TIGR02543 family)
VTFVGNGGSGDMNPQSSTTPDGLESNGFTRAGYTFVGWNTAPNGAGTSYSDGQTYAFTSDMTLYAQWKLIPAPGPAPGPAPSPETAPEPEPVNPPPLAATNDVNAMTVNSSVSGSLAENDTYPPGSTYTKITDPVNGTAVVNPDGTYTYRPNNGFIGKDEFTYQVCMPAPNEAMCSRARVIVTVLDEGMPVAQPVTKSVRSGSTSSVTFKPKITFPTSSLQISKRGSSNWGSRITVRGKGKWILKGRQVRFIPSARFIGVTTIRYRVIDANGKAAYSRFTAVARAKPGSISAGVSEAGGDPNRFSWRTLFAMIRLRP